MSKRMTRRVGLLTCFLVIGVAIGFIVRAAADTPSSETKYLHNYQEHVFVAQGIIHLRDGSPENIAGWYTKGKQVGYLKEGERITVRSIKEYPSLLGSEVYAQVRRLFDVSGRGVSQGWIFWGENYLIPESKTSPSS